MNLTSLNDDIEAANSAAIPPTAIAPMTAPRRLLSPRLSTREICDQPIGATGALPRCTFLATGATS